MTIKFYPKNVYKYIKNFRIKKEMGKRVKKIGAFEKGGTLFMYPIEVVSCV